MKNMFKKLYKVILTLTVLLICVAMMFACNKQDKQGAQGVPGEKGADGQTPFVGENGNWWIGSIDTGIAVAGRDGKDGKDGANGINGTDGKDGVSVSSFVINDKGELVVSFTDNSVLNLGRIVGENGKDGEDGEDGKDGVNGTNGEDGIAPKLQYNDETGVVSVSYDDGENWTELLNLKTALNDAQSYVSVRTCEINSQGELVIVLTNDERIELGVVKGKDGINGANGTNGKDGITPQLKIVDNAWMISYDNGENWVELGCQARGETGNDGVTPIIKINNDGYWIVSSDNGTTWKNLGVKATGENGKNGENGAAGIGIQNVEIVAGYLMVTYTDGNTVNAGPINAGSGSTGDTIVSDIYTDALEFYPIGNGDQYAVSIGKAIYMSSIVIPSTYNGKPVTEILASGFAAKEGQEDILTSIVIPDSITKIGAYAFSNRTVITAIYVPDSVTEIGAYAFGEVQSVVFERTEAQVPDGQNWSALKLGYYKSEWGKANNS